MAEITSEKFLDAMRAVAGGHFEDSTGGIKDRVQGLVTQRIELPVNAENVTLTDAVTRALSSRASAVGGGKIVRITYTPVASFTVSQTDHQVVSVVKLSAPTWSATLSVGTFTSTTDGVAAAVYHGPDKPSRFTLSTTTDNLKVNDGDSFFFVVAKNGAAGANTHTTQLGRITIEVR